MAIVKKDGGCDVGGAVDDGSDAEEVGHHRVDSRGFIKCLGDSWSVVTTGEWGALGGMEGD